VWSGELIDFCAANPEFPAIDLANSLGPPDRFVRIGGGATAEFTLFEESIYRELLAGLEAGERFRARPVANHSPLDIPDETEEQRFWHEAACERAEAEGRF
jgi:hypothetical protein